MPLLFSIDPIPIQTKKVGIIQQNYLLTTMETDLRIYILACKSSQTHIMTYAGDIYEGISNDNGGGII